MKLGSVELPRLDEVPRLGLAAFRSRIVFHGVFLLLAAATLALAVSLLLEEKQRSYQRYEQGFKRSLGEVAAQLRHPTGQLALLNPGLQAGRPITPLLLPFSAIDFDDPAKAQRVVEMSGCALQFRSGASLCVAVGSKASAGGFIYLVGSLDAGPLKGRERGALDLAELHRARITLTMRSQDWQWIAPFEAMSSAGEGQLGRLTGFIGGGDKLAASARPQRDFRGWLWREGPCLAGSSGADCPRRTLYSIRLPVEAWREALFEKPAMAWPPVDLYAIALRVELLAPDGAPPLFDSNAGELLPPSVSLAGVGASLQAGETLTISRDGKPVSVLRGAVDPDELPSPWLTRLIRRLPVQVQVPQLRADDSVATPLGRYDLRLDGDWRSLDRALSASAARASWLVGAMLAAIALAWLIITLGLMRRVARLTRRAAAVSYEVQHPQVEQRLGQLDVADLRGSDEVGILAGSMADLLERVRDSLRREHLRAEHERDMWHAVGHEIMSPLQSLLVLHGAPEDPSFRYLQRMQQAVRVLYGAASPSEAIASATLDAGRLDLDQFLKEVAANAQFADIADVRYAALGEPVWVKADAYSLEDVVTHVLRNADRYRPAGTPISLSLTSDDSGAIVEIHNQGPAIGPGLVDKIFEYGVSDQPQGQGERRGQGLFVAKTYLAKMDGEIAARNVEGGVVFELRLRRSS
ncbi:HAMP domain-containing sensor histidine kinase [Pelomonas sp. SE-A7]|uniref:sensor histidine kinase n=1 Tax=Pelomonas sp. SE-A7 TaxID=3054953 RepID=UPI00259C95AA|nr:HAMP domain-containing sensor histidine kinase [Pelomonas sp. SE-A7]MDM4768509.1 HAMP domain-containing sensor histidine kinase [Pelomonas sp. SE-A7]